MFHVIIAKGQGVDVRWNQVHVVSFLMNSNTHTSASNSFIICYDIFDKLHYSKLIYDGY